MCSYNVLITLFELIIRIIYLLQVTKYAREQDHVVFRLQGPSVFPEHNLKATNH